VNVFLEIDRNYHYRELREWHQIPTLLPFLGLNSTRRPVDICISIYKVHSASCKRRRGDFTGVWKTPVKVGEEDEKC